MSIPAEKLNGTEQEPKEGGQSLRAVPDLATLELVIPLGPEALVLGVLYQVGDFDKTEEAVKAVEDEVAAASRQYYFNFVGRSFANRPSGPAVNQLLSQTYSLISNPVIVELAELREDAIEKDMSDETILQVTHATYIGRILLQERRKREHSASLLEQ